MAVRALTVSVGLIAAAATLAAPAHADPVDDAFLSALDGAGVNSDDPGSMVSLGQSICPMLVQPGQTLTSTALSITGNNGMPPAIADLFVSTAVSMYCPALMADVADGNLSDLSQIPGQPGAQIPGLPGAQIPSLPGPQIPGLPGI